MTEPRILIVEDDPDGQRMVAHIVNSLQVQVDIVSTAEDAAVLLFNEQNQYVAAIIDLALPGIDGWALYDQIRDHPHTAQLPCMAITAYHSSQVKSRAAQAGFATYVTKPIDVVSLAQTLENFLV